MTTTVADQHTREFRMPDVGEGLTEAIILAWHVKPGDTVIDGQSVCEVETAKTAVELPIPYDGVVRELLFPEGATVDVGAVIITVDARPTPPSDQSRVTPRPNGVLVGYGAMPDANRRRTPPAAVTGPPAGPASVPPRPLAKPPVRKLAKDLGVDLSTVQPSRTDGKIVRDDVLAAAAAARAHPAATAAAAAVPVADGSANGRDGRREIRIPITGVRKATAEAMVRSAFTAPQVTEFITVDVTRTVKFVQRLREDPQYSGLRVGPLLVLARALVIALRRHPELNAAWDERRREIVRKRYVNLGIAVASKRGLVVPNIKEAQRMSLRELSAALTTLVTDARAGTTSLADTRGGTVTITNIGVFGVDTATPILNPGEAAILALGSIARRPWVHRDTVEARHVTTLALSFDHRLVDGDVGSRVLSDVAAMLEDPLRLVAWCPPIDHDQYEQ